MTRGLLYCRDEKVSEAIQDAAGPDLRLTVCADVQEAAARHSKSRFSIQLVHLAEGEGIQEVQPLLRAVTAARRTCVTFVLASHFTDEQIAELYRIGVANYLTLPADLPRLPRMAQGILRLIGPETKGEAQAVSPIDLGDIFDGFPEEMEILTDQVRRVAPQETTVLLTGETGTGKTRLARLLHELSPRRGEPFLTVDCGSLAAGLIESELFGHAKGAFTGADRERAGKLSAAGNGTLFLDEVNSLPLPLQAKLLRAADERVFEPVGSERPRAVRARLVAASNVPLEQEVKAGRFRADLFYRLNVVGFYLPPLRERRGRVVPLARTFLAEFAGRNGRDDLHGFSPAAERLLASYDWPGNIRELRNAVMRGVALSNGPDVQPEDLPETLRGSTGTAVPIVLPPNPPTLPPTPTPSQPLTLASSKQELEIRRILEALQKHGNNRLRTAAELGISRVALYKKLRKYGLMSPRYRKRGEDT